MSNTRKFIVYLKMYAGSFVSLLIHELSHFVVALFSFIIGLGQINGFPLLKITEYPKIDVKEGRVYTQNLGTGHISCAFEYHFVARIFFLLTVLAPLFSTVALFILGPLWVKVFVVLNLNTLLPSGSDMAHAKLLWSGVHISKIK